MSIEMKQKKISITPAQHFQLHQEAKRTGNTTMAIIRLAIVEYLKRHKI